MMFSNFPQVRNISYAKVCFALGEMDDVLDSVCPIYHGGNLCRCADFMVGIVS